MSVCSDVADYVWLTGDDACALLDELAEEDQPLHTAVAKLRSRVSPERAHLLLEQVELRRRAIAKFSRSHRMFFTRTGLEQATDEWVATYKASRLTPQRAGPSPAPAADLCCGIGGDLLALAAHGTTIGIDRNPVAAHFAAINTDAEVSAADVTRFNLDGVSAWHIDPDRRPDGRRTTSLQVFQPGLDTIEQLLARNPNAAVKLAPATKVHTDWSKHCELEWISRDRQCRQLVAWHGSLAQFPGQRRATILHAACGLAQRTIIGAPDQPIPVVPHLDRYIFDADPSILAARLKGALANEHELSALDHGPTYLTGPRPIADAAFACFEVAEILPLHNRKLASHLRERGIGQLEIKKRGVEIDPEKLRRDLKLRGDNAATLLITRIAGRSAAILAHRAM